MKKISIEEKDSILACIKESYKQKTDKAYNCNPETNVKSAYDDFLDRNEFSRDRDKILFSKAFRRLEHKAQVYSHSKGDHFRTRLTHTIEVVQISRSIARNLGLNEDLTEAIAFGHDIGHTPFGHEGERVLDNIMCGEEDLGGKFKYKLDFGGFKHNFNSLKVLDILEKKYKTVDGLYLTWQTKDGILKHTKTRKNEKKWDLSRFINPKLKKNKINLSYPNFPNTLEGQVVAIADEIAQRQHDMDDGLRDDKLKLKESTIIDYILDIINKERLKTMKKAIDELFKIDENITIHLSSGSTLHIKGLYTDLKKRVKAGESIEKIYNELKKPIEIPFSPSSSDLIPNPFNKFSHGNFLLDELANRIQEREKYRILDDSLFKKCIDHAVNNLDIDSNEEKALIELKTKLENKYIITDEITRENEYRWNSLVRDIIDYFIKDVTLNSLAIIQEDSSKSVKTHFRRQIITKKLICCSKTSIEINKGIKQFIDNRIVNSYDVNRFDGKAVFIVKQLFKAYYTNPKQMPKVWLDLMSKRIMDNSKEYKCDIKLENKVLFNIKFRTSPPKEIDKLVKLLKLELNKSEIQNLLIKNLGKNKYCNLDESFLKNIGGPDLSKKKENCEFCDKEEYERELLSNIFHNINNLNRYGIKWIQRTNDLKTYKTVCFIKTMIENHYVYMSIICDHIAGMTDNFANNEYQKLYLV